MTEDPSNSVHNELSKIHIVPSVDEHERRIQRALSDLQAVTPTNAYGFPLGIYRPDLLPFHDYLPESEAVSSLFRSPQSPQTVPLAGSPQGDHERVAESTDADDVSHSDPRLSETQQRQDRPTGRSPSSLLDRARNVFLHDDDDMEIEFEEEEDDLDELLEDQEEEEEGDLQHSESSDRGSGRGLVQQSSNVAPSQQSSRIAGFRREHLKAAFIPLSYNEGYPTLPDGRPVWDRLDYEPPEAHVCFQAYLQMPHAADGVRTTSDLATLMAANNLLHVNGFDLRDYSAKFRMFATVYYWSTRAKAYDLFRAAAFRKKQELRALDVLDSHYEKANRLLNRLMVYMEDEEDFWDTMSPKVAESLFKTLTSVMRVSAGMPAATPNTKEGSGGGGVQTFEMILRTLAQGNNLSSEEGSSDGGRGLGVTIDGESSNLTARILNDPDSTRIAQELILRMTRPRQE